MNPKRTFKISSAAFTLIELMVVIAIMVLMMAVAIPALRSIMGTRSNEVAMNKISAYLGNARLQAIGLVQEEGVFFYLDPQTELMTMTQVYTTPALQTDPTMTGSGGAKLIIHYVDLVANSTRETLPTGVGFQVVNSWYRQNPAVTGFTNEYAGYMSPPTNPDAPFFAGLILFDSQGHALSVPYGCRCWTAAVGTTGMGQLISGSSGQYGSGNSTYLPGGSSSIAPATAFAFTLYNPEAFINAGYNVLVPSTTGQDTWLDAYGLETMVNRGNGTLVKGE